jgi:uncharacterized protein YicC (UPF0701 family)
VVTAAAVLAEARASELDPDKVAALVAARDEALVQSMARARELEGDLLEVKSSVLLRQIEEIVRRARWKTWLCAN